MALGLSRWVDDNLDQLSRLEVRTFGPQQEYWSGTAADSLLTACKCL